MRGTGSHTRAVKLVITGQRRGLNSVVAAQARDATLRNAAVVCVVLYLFSNCSCGERERRGRSEGDVLMLLLLLRLAEAKAGGHTGRSVVAWDRTISSLTSTLLKLRSPPAHSLARLVCLVASAHTAPQPPSFEALTVDILTTISLLFSVVCPAVGGSFLANDCPRLSALVMIIYTETIQRQTHTQSPLSHLQHLYPPLPVASSCLTAPNRLYVVPYSCRSSMHTFFPLHLPANTAHTIRALVLCTR